MYDSIYSISRYTHSDGLPVKGAIHQGLERFSVFILLHVTEGGPLHGLGWRIVRIRRGVWQFIWKENPGGSLNNGMIFGVKESIELGGVSFTTKIMILSIRQS